MTIQSVPLPSDKEIVNFCKDLLQRIDDDLVADKPRADVLEDVIFRLKRVVDESELLAIEDPPYTSP